MHVYCERDLWKGLLSSFRMSGFLLRRLKNGFQYGTLELCGAKCNTWRRKSGYATEDEKEEQRQERPAVGWMDANQNIEREYQEQRK